MIFKFKVKHNGVIYQPGKEVPVGIEAKKENIIQDKSATEIKKELKELGVTKFKGNSKVILMEQLQEVLEQNKEVKEEVPEEAIEVEASEEEIVEPDEETFLEKIIKE